MMCHFPEKLQACKFKVLPTWSWYKIFSKPKPLSHNIQMNYVNSSCEVIIQASYIVEKCIGLFT